MSGDITPYTNLVTSEHADKPNFIATLSVLVQSLADTSAALGTSATAYDLDQAVGVQLDVIGQWIGRSRQLSVPITGVYFSLDTSGLGLDQGTIQGPFDPSTGLVSLPDDSYRTLLKAKILANSWDGTIPNAYDAYALLFPTQPFRILIQDHGDMTMTLIMVGTPLDAVTQALFTQGLLSLRPAGVLENFTIVNSIIFGLDIENDALSGLDVGTWATFL